MCPSSKACQAEGAHIIPTEPLTRVPRVREARSLMRWPSP